MQLSIKKSRLLFACSLRLQTKKSFALVTSDIQIVTMFLLCRFVFCFILSLIFALRLVKGNSGYAVQWCFGFSNCSSLDLLHCQETELPLCSKLCFSEGCFSSENVPSGNETSWLAVHSSRGPSVHDATVAALTDRVQIGKPLLLEVSGILNLSKENVSMVFITFSGNSGPQGLHNISVMANGYLTCYIDAILQAAGLYYLNVTMMNSIYTHFASWKIRACPFGTEYLNLMLSKRDQDIPSCAPLPTDAEDKQQGKASTRSIDSHKRAVWIFSDKRAYASETDIQFVAVTEEPDPLYFHWKFGDGPEIKTTSRIYKKRYLLPDKYSVTVSVSNGLTSISSDVYPLVIQRAVQPNRLLYSPSVLSHSFVNFTCRISAGTDVSYVWNFGDGTERDGSSTEHHVYNRTGEYIVEVIMSNLVSSASLTGHIFVVEELCQPPPVKNMGPNKIQVWRYQTVHLAVTFEAQIQCNVTRGLLYRWTIYDMSGRQLLFPHIDMGRQYTDLPKYLLHYGTYKAIAKVQVTGSVVYSNYSVLIEVVRSPPVSVISEATNIFINRQSGTIITLDGRESHDPDYPNNTMSYSWSCKPVNSEESSCFNRNIVTTSAVLTFPALFLKPDFDLLKFTLTVYSGHRSSSSEMFITVTSKHVSNIHMSCKHFRENSVNWNEQFSVSAFCDACGFNAKNVTYYWKLYLVNSSSKAVPEIPFCSSMDLGLPSKMEESLHFSKPAVTPYTPAYFTKPSVPVSLAPYLLSEDTDLTAPVTQDTLTSIIHKKHHNISVPTLIENPSTNTYHHAAFPTMASLHPPFLPSFPEETESSGSQWEYQGSLPASDKVSLTDMTSDFHTEDMIYTDVYQESISGDHLSLPEYDYYSFGIEEADPGVPVGRPTGIYFYCVLCVCVCGTNSLGFSWNISFPHSYDNEGDNLVDPRLHGPAVSEKTLLDLHRKLIHPSVFESYTLTGLSSSVVTFKPFILKPKSLYLLEVSAISEERLQGKSQLFFQTQAVPEGLSCQVQPNTGYEIHTYFSIFCSSGKEDLLYEYSFSVGNSPRKLLYKGRDFQHYFSLPSGDPNDDYKVTIYIEIKNRFGATTKPCPVKVTVLPSFQRNASSQLSPDQELYMYGVGNLTGLSKIGSNRDIINYISLLIAVLNRLSLDAESSVELLTLTRTSIITAACQLSSTDKGILFEKIYRLTDLIRVSSQVTFYSAKQVIQHVDDISSLSHESKPPAGHILDTGMVQALVSLLSSVLEAPVLTSRPGHQLTNKVLYTITDLVLECLLSSNVWQYNVNTMFMEVLAWKDERSHSGVKTFGLTAFHLTDFLEMQFQQWSRNSQHKPCVITWLTVYRQSPYRWSRHVQLSGETAEIRLYNCTTRKEIKVRHLSTPVTIEFQRKEETNRSPHTRFTLLRGQVNTHQFNITSQSLQRAIQITVQFNRPAECPFPILLLLRMYEQPTPNLYNKQNIYHWKGQTARIFLPQSYLQAASSVYLRLLNADFNKSPSNKYIARAVNYTLRIESVECLSWDGVKEWKRSGCFPHGGVSTDKIYCSCNHLASFAVSHENIISSYNSADVSQFIHSETNYILIIFSVIFLALYVVVLVICRKADVSIQKTTGSFLLPENNPSDRFLYAVTIDTGLRSRTRMTAKVHIVLYGDKGVSQTRELSSSDSKLFTCNSRNTFILSSPESLGRVWKLHLWHDNGGSSPSWYLSHVVVKDLVQGSCWFFLGQCWLAVDEGDGRVERSLVASECSLTFKQFLYLKLTEYLEDLHPWLSVYSRPSFSSHTHTQRWSVCLLLLQGYMCVSAVLVNLLEEQCFVEMGLIDVSPVSMVTGLCSALAVLPVGGLVSLVFRVSKTTSSSVSGEQYKVKVPDVYSVEDHHDALLINDCASYLSWNTVSQWTQGSWKTDYKDWKTSDSVSLSKLQEDPDAILEIVEDSMSDVNSRSHDKCKWKKSDLKSHTSAGILENRQVCGGRIQSLQSWCYYVGWSLCLSLSLTCFIITGTLGVKFDKTKTLLWAYSVFFSLVCCGFVLHPAMILITAITVSLLLRKKPDWFHSLSVKEPVTELLRHRDQKLENVFVSKYQQSHFEKTLAARQRARYLRLVEPPNSRELKCVRGQMKKQTLLHKTARDLMFHLIMLLTVLFVTYGKSDNDYKYHLNQAIKSHFTKSPQNSFHSIQKHDDWWNWTTTAFLERLYDSAICHDKRVENETGDFSCPFSLIGSPVIRKIKSTYNSSCQILNLLGKNNIKCSDNQSVEKRHSLCGKVWCYEGESVSVSLGKTRSKAIKSIKKLRDTGWMTPFTQIVMVQFILYNGPSNLFTAVTILVEQTSTGALIPSASIQSTRLYHFPAALDYSVMTCELLFLVFILLHMYRLIYLMTQREWLYWRNLWSWLEVTVFICSLLRFICSVYIFMLKTETIDFLQKEDFELLVDLSPIFFCEQLSQSLLGVVVNLLLLKCVSLLRLNKAMAAAVSTWKLIFSNLLWLLAPGVIVAVALSSLRNLIFHSFPFTSITRSAHLLFTRFFCMSHFSDIYLQAQVPSTIYFGAILCTMIPFNATVIAALTFFVKQKKKTKKRKHLLTVFELMSYVKDKALLIVGKASHKSIDHQVHTNRVYLAEIEDVMDELLFHLCTMSDSLHNTLPAKENLFETQSNFSVPLSGHVYSSDSESVIFDGLGKKHLGCQASYRENTHRSSLEHITSQYLQGRGRMQEESFSRGPRNFRNCLKDPIRESEGTGQAQILSSSKQTHCAKAEWKDKVYIKSSIPPDPSRLADERNFAIKTQIMTQKMRGHTLLTSSTRKVNMGHHTAHGKRAGESYVFNTSSIEGMDNSVQGQTIIPGFIEQCM
ncbi:polycystic kidney disease 1 like 1 [Cyprinus carpio]|uniref:Polycystic kidney disease 1 like 1 n=1 Tax=Cyprinus carpio TaxID=7962 RepID=A0A9R0AR81_CYPCA|nr:polycystic kidney disease 1 like 1 [Cyprinus carpio]